MEEEEAGSCEVLQKERGFCLALARFESPTTAMKFIRSQRRHQRLQTAKLWAAENRSRDDRRRLKAVSKLKKYLVELGS